MRGAANAPGRPERRPGLPELAELPFGAVMTALVALTLAGAVLALTCGSFPVSAQDALAAVWAHLAGEAPADRTIASIVVNVRLPRIILAIAAGAGLAAAGAGFQAIFSNPLATPDTLGVATGAAFGAVLGILLGLGPAAVQAASLAAGLAAVALVFFVSRLRGRTSVLMLILSGLVIAALFSALISLVKYVADPQDVLPSITFWMMGSFTGATLPALLAGLPFIVAGAAALWLLRWRMNVLSLPEDEARSLGVPVGLLRTAVIVASTMMIRQFMSESVEHMEMHAGLAVLKEESLLEAEEILPDAAAADPTSSGEPWLPCPVTLSVTEISRVVAATRSSVSTRLSEWCAAGLMRKDVRAMSFRPALFEGGCATR